MADEPSDFELAKRIRYALRLAVAFTIGVGAAVIATALPYPFHGPRPPYDAGVLLGGLEVVALVWAGFFAWRAYPTQQTALNYQREHDAAQVRAKRRSLAKALGAEVELNLQYVAAARTVLVQQANNVPSDFRLSTLTFTALAPVIGQLDSPLVADLIVLLLCTPIREALWATESH